MTYLISMIIAVFISLCILEDFSLMGQFAIGVLIGMNGYMAWYSMMND